MNDERGFARQARTAALLALPLLLLWDLSALDLPITRLFASQAGFAWRHEWFLATALHDGARFLSWLAALALAVNVRWPLTPRLTRRERLWWLLATLASAAVVPLLKQHSLTSCPWDLAEFGGHAHHVPHWLQFGPAAIADGGGGHCFPSGHATTAFAFFSSAFALRRAHPLAARRCLWTVLVFGLGLGAVQLARGAHYPSHTLWSGWLCFSVNTALARWLPAPAAQAVAAERAQQARPGQVAP